jgi:hypothetical protein
VENGELKSITPDKKVMKHFLRSWFDNIIEAAKIKKLK